MFPHAVDRYLEIFDFDNATGNITNPIRVDTDDKEYEPYGLEFSPNNRFLYTADYKSGTPYYGRLVQYNLSVSDIASTRAIVTEERNVAYRSLQFASNQQIYVTHGAGRGTLHSITNPNTSAANLNLARDVVNLNPPRARTRIGFPNFVRGFISTVQLSNICVNVASRFELTGRLAINNAVWNFGDGSPTVNNLSPTHTYNRKGLYTVSVDITYNNGRRKTLNQVIEIDSAAPTLAPFPDMCVTTPALTLNQGTPTGGTYSGRGVDAATATFNPLQQAPASILSPMSIPISTAAQNV